jgi:hypothetical protein
MIRIAAAAFLLPAILWATPATAQPTDPMIAKVESGLVGRLRIEGEPVET